MARTKRTYAPISDEDFKAAMIHFYRGYSNTELVTAINTRNDAIVNGFLTKKEQKDFKARVAQMQLVLDSRAS
jgi:hypothetical protein